MDEKTIERNRASFAVDTALFVAAALALLCIDNLLVPPGVFQGFLTIIGSFVVVMAITRFRRENLADLGLSKPKRLWSLPLWVLAIVVVTFSVAIGGQMIVARFIETPPVDLSKFSILQNNVLMLMVSLVSIWVTAAFFEEIVYRGFLLRNLVEVSGNGVLAVTMMILLHAVLFGLLHLYQGIFGMITTGLVAVVFGVFYLLQKRNLWALIVVHGLIDTLNVVNFYFNGVPQPSG